MSTTKTPTTIPTALERVRAFVREAKAQGDDEVAWSVPDHYPDANRGRLLALSIGDLEEVLALVGDQSVVIVQTYERADHPVNVGDVGTTALQERYAVLVSGTLSEFTRCECTENPCYWYDSRQIDDELTRRGVR